VWILVTQGRTHYSKPPRSVPRTKTEMSCGSGDVHVWHMTPEEIKEYFATKYPNLERDREFRKNKIW
jgi:hypothetical protein